jgi:hypothetical protein
MSMKLPRSAAGRVSRHAASTRPRCTAKAHRRDRGAWRVYSNSRRPGRLGPAGRSGHRRARAWRPVFSSTEGTTAPAGGRRCTSLIAVTFSRTGGSGLGNHPRPRCGRTSPAASIRGWLLRLTSARGREPPASWTRAAIVRVGRPSPCSRGWQARAGSSRRVTGPNFGGGPRPGAILPTPAARHPSARPQRLTGHGWTSTSRATAAALPLRRLVPHGRDARPSAPAHAPPGSLPLRRHRAFGSPRHAPPWRLFFRWDRGVGPLVSDLIGDPLQHPLGLAIAGPAEA